jgi:hypothetical protein
MRNKQRKTNIRSTPPGGTIHGSQPRTSAFFGGLNISVFLFQLLVVSSGHGTNRGLEELLHCLELGEGEGAGSVTTTTSSGALAGAPGEASDTTSS